LKFHNIATLSFLLFCIKKRKKWLQKLAQLFTIEKIPSKTALKQVSGILSHWILKSQK
jgi:hypothetical protein